MKKKRALRTQLTHFEVRRDRKLRLRLAIADDAVVSAGDELGALLRKIGGVPTSVVVSPSVVEVVSPSPEEFVISPHHPPDDEEYHGNLREHLAELFGSLCDSALDDALKIARAELARRADVADGGN